MGPGVVVGGAAEVVSAGVVLGGRVVGGGKDGAARAHQHMQVPDDEAQHDPFGTRAACNSREWSDTSVACLPAACLTGSAARICTDSLGVDGAGVVLLGAGVVLHGYLFFHRSHALS